MATCAGNKFSPPPRGFPLIFSWPGGPLYNFQALIARPFPDWKVFAISLRPFSGSAVKSPGRYSDTLRNVR